ncbi:MAG: aldehyde dehydrogenase family protein [Pseudonocardiaceae bacterium]
MCRLCARCAKPRFYRATGGCVGITPWSFPSAMVARKVAPALMAGNGG